MFKAVVLVLLAVTVEGTRVRQTTASTFVHPSSTINQVKSAWPYKWEENDYDREIAGELSGPSHEHFLEDQVHLVQLLGVAADDATGATGSDEGVAGVPFVHQRGPRCPLLATKNKYSVE